MTFRVTILVQINFVDFKHFVFFFESLPIFYKLLFSQSHYM